MISSIDCANGRVDELVQLHRFSHEWEASASLQLRQGNPHALDAYDAHGRIIAGTLATHLEPIARTWIEHHHEGGTIGRLRRVSCCHRASHGKDGFQF